jgi:predicted protein tyrosine phosphatase
MHVLFICNQGRNRSKTAAEMLSDRFTTASAGLYNDRPVTETPLYQADLVIGMEEKHRTELARRFPAMYLRKRILVLGIPDIYRYGQPQLLQLLQTRMSELLEPFLKLLRGGGS